MGTGRVPTAFCPAPARVPVPVYHTGMYRDYHVPTPAVGAVTDTSDKDITVLALAVDTYCLFAFAVGWRPAVSGRAVSGWRDYCGRVDMMVPAVVADRKTLSVAIPAPMRGDSANS